MTGRYVQLAMTATDLIDDHSLGDEEAVTIM